MTINTNSRRIHYQRVSSSEFNLANDRLTDDNGPLEWSLRATVSIILSLVIFFLFPLLFGLVGFALTSFVAGVFAVLFITRVLKIPLQSRQIFLLYFLLLSFLNFDAINVIPELSFLPRLSWFIVLPLAAYSVYYWGFSFDALKRNRLVLLLLYFMLFQLAWSIKIHDGTIIIDVIERSIVYMLFLVVSIGFIWESAETQVATFYGLIFCGMAAAVILILEFANPAVFGMSTSFRLGGVARSAAFYLNANAAAFAVSFALLALSWMTARGLFPKYLALFLFIVIATGVLATFSRKGIFFIVLGLIGFIDAFFPTTYRIGPLFIKSFSILMVCIIIFFSSSIFLTPRYVSRLDIGGDSQERLIQMGQMLRFEQDSYSTALEEGRGSIFRLSLDRIWEKPLAGHGTGITNIANDAIILGYQPHNQFLLVWLENGVFIFLLFSVICIGLIISILKSERTQLMHRLMLYLHLLVMMLGSHTVFHFRYMGLIVALVVAAPFLYIVTPSEYGERLKSEG